MTTTEEKVLLLEEELRSCSSSTNTIFKIFNEALDSNMNKIYFTVWIMSITIITLCLYMFNIFTYTDDDGVNRLSIMKFVIWIIILSLLSASIGYTCVISLNLNSN